MADYINFLMYQHRFFQMSTVQLIEHFNSLVKNNAWVAARSVHDYALIKEFKRRRIDISAIYDGECISFAKPVALDNNYLVIIE